MFMHGDMWHLIGNMIYLWAFGRRVEDSAAVHGASWRIISSLQDAGGIGSRHV